MPKRSSRPRQESDADDPNVTAFRAFRVVQEATDDTGEPMAAVKPAKNPAAVALGKLGGKKGGLARAAKLSAEQRAQIARKAAKARWDAEK